MDSDDELPHWSILIGREFFRTCRCIALSVNVSIRQDRRQRYRRYQEQRSQTRETQSLELAHVEYKDESSFKVSQEAPNECGERCASCSYVRYIMIAYSCTSTAKAIPAVSEIIEISSDEEQAHCPTAVRSRSRNTKSLFNIKTNKRPELVIVATRSPGTSMLR